MAITFKNTFRQHKIILYRLKRNFGVTATFDEITALTHNLRTGVKSVSSTTHSVRRAIVLPGDLSKKFSYDITFLAGNNNFAYGAFFDDTLRSVIVLKSDLPSTFNLKLEYYVNIESQRYAVKNRVKDPCDIAYLFVANRIEGQ